MSIIFTISFIGSHNSVPGYRTLNSEFAAKNQFPYLVRIYEITKAAGKVHDVTACTGILVAEDLVLTAAHCAESGGRVIVVHGDSDHTDFINSGFACDKSTGKYFCYNVRSIIIHPDYSETKSSVYYDVAILRLENPMPVSDGHKIFSCSVLGSGTPQNCTLVGWGDSVKDFNYNKLQYKSEVATESCSGKWFMPKHICLKYHQICVGDSGGPLICDNLIYGIASFMSHKSKEKPKLCEFFKKDYYTPAAVVRDFLIEHGGCRSTRMKCYASTILTVSIHVIYFCFTTYE